MIRRPPRSTLFPLHDALPIYIGQFVASRFPGKDYAAVRVDNTAHWLQGPYVNAYDGGGGVYIVDNWFTDRAPVGTFVCKSGRTTDRKSTRLNSSHANISYAVF